MKNYSVGIVQLLRPHKLIDLLGFETSIYSAIEITLYNASWYIPSMRTEPSHV